MGWAVLGWAACSCGPEPDSAFRLSEAPHPQHRLDTEFGEAVQLVGYDLEAETVTPGRPFRVTWYWHCKRPLGGRWRVFTHLVDASGELVQNEDGNGETRRRYRAGQWRAGEHIRDTQQITIRRPHRMGYLQFYLGLWDGQRRLPVTRGPTDSQGRARAAQIELIGEPASPSAPPDPPVPTLAAWLAAGEISVDGRLDEPEWVSAPRTSAFVSSLSGVEAPPHTTAKALWDETSLYLGVEVADDALHAGLHERDARLWEQDVVEIFIDPDEGETHRYFQVDVSPSGVVFDTSYDSRRLPGPEGHMDWDAHATVSATLRGRLDDAQPDEGYTLEVALPWVAFTTSRGEALAPPSPGGSWRVNLYVVDRRSDGTLRDAAWSPTLERDFHVPARFGRIHFRGSR